MSSNFQDIVNHIVRLVNEFDWAEGNYWCNFQSDQYDIEMRGTHDPKQREPRVQPFHFAVLWEFENPATDLTVEFSIDTSKKTLTIREGDEKYSCEMPDRVINGIMRQENASYFTATEYRDWVLQDPHAFVEACLSMPTRMSYGRRGVVLCDDCDKVVLQYETNDVFVWYESDWLEFDVHILSCDDGEIDPPDTFKFRVTEQQHQAIREAVKKACKDENVNDDADADGDDD